MTSVIIFKTTTSPSISNKPFEPIKRRKCQSCKKRFQVSKERHRYCNNCDIKENHSQVDLDEYQQTTPLNKAAI